MAQRNTQDCLDLLKRADGSLADAFGAIRALGEPLTEWDEIRKGDVAIVASAQYGDTFAVGTACSSVSAKTISSAHQRARR